MFRLLFSQLLLTLLVANTYAEAAVSTRDEAENQANPDIHTVFAQRGYLDDGSLLSGQADTWKEIIDTLSRLRFNYIGTGGGQPAAPVSEYLQERGLTVRVVATADEGEDGIHSEPVGDRPIRVISKQAQKLWAVSAPDLPENSELLWADDGSAGLLNWPSDNKGFDIGVLLHAGDGLNGPVQDPYPGRLGESLAEATKRGMSGNALVSAPGFWPFALNLEAAAAAMQDPEAFDSDLFYSEWATRNFGAKSAELTVKSLKLLHGAHGHVPGFGFAAKSSMQIVRNLDQDKAGSDDMSPISNALRLSRRSLELATEANGKTPMENRAAHDTQVVFPATLFVQNLELLESLTQLSSAWKIYRAVPPTPVSQQRVTGLLAEAQSRAENLKSTMKKVSGTIQPREAGIRLPAPEEIEALTDKL